jgi:preprotein translocase subunit SecD
VIAVRHLVVLAAAAIALAACSSSGSPRSADDVTLTLTAAGATTPTELASAAKAVRSRLGAEGITAHTSVSGGVIRLSAPSSARSAVEAAALPGVLTFRELYPLADDMTSASPVASPSAEGLAAATTVTGLHVPSNEANQTAPSAATMAQFAALDCTKDARPAAIDEDPHHFVVACDRNGLTKYLLTPADLVAAQVASADATMGQTPIGQPVGLWEVDVTFKDSAVPQVEKLSARLFHHNMQQLAITLDGVVVSAPSTNGVLGANITISGGRPPFSHQEASALAHTLTSGPLPFALTVRS